MIARAVERFLDAADAARVRADVRRFPDGTKTAADAARAIGCDVAQIVKSLVFVVDERPVIAFTSGWRARYSPAESGPKPCTTL